MLHDGCKGHRQRFGQFADRGGPNVSRSTIVRLLLSANAWKVRSRSIVWLGMCFSMRACDYDSQVHA